MGLRGLCGSGRDPVGWGGGLWGWGSVRGECGTGGGVCGAGGLGEVLRGLWDGGG